QVRAGVAAVDRHRAREQAPGEVRHEPASRAQQRRLAGPGGTDDESQPTFADAQLHSVQGRDRRTRVGDGDVLEADHDALLAMRAGATAAATQRTTKGGAAASPTGSEVAAAGAEAA